MKQTILILSCMNLIACGQGFKYASTGGGATLASSANNASNNNNSSNNNNNNNSSSNDTITNELGNDQISAVGGYADDILEEIIQGLQGFGSGDVSFHPNGPYSINHVINCPLGGTAVISASGTTSLSIDFVSISAGLANGVGSVTFSQCKFNRHNQTVTLDGTLALSDVSGNFNASRSLTAIAGSFSAQNSIAGAGSLHIVSGSVDKTCQFELTRSSNISGSMTFLPSFSLSGSAQIHGTLQICDKSFSQNISESL